MRFFVSDPRPSANGLFRVCVVALVIAGSFCQAGPAADEKAQAQAGWPGVRGRWANGDVASPGDTSPVGLPLHGSETENVAWKTEIAETGWSTPGILGKDVWLTTATEDGHDFFAICVDANTGAVRINEKIFHCDIPEPLNNGVNCYASPSPVIEPGRVYVHFGSYGTACLDTATGKPLWKRDDMPCRHFRGPGSSPSFIGTC